MSCLEAPELKVRIDRGMSVTASAARRAEEGTIFLDGAAQSEPFLDLERRVYNLDHHEGCVRPFTLSTCEQALILVSRGLDVRENPWQIHANEPDLDAVLAIWLLLNSMHLQASDTSIRDVIVPLVRLEGVIDTHGLERADLTGLPPDLLRETRRRLDRLRDFELERRQQGQWDEMDVLEYVSAQLQALDRMVYPADFFEAFRGIEQLARVELTDNRIAVICRCDCGIYELEKELTRLYGKRLGVIALEKASGAYTLRQVDPFLPVDLEAAYLKFNVLDPAVKASGAADRWGGSGEIGGSPRKSGTALSPADIADALRLAYRRPTLVDRAQSVLWAIVVSMAPLLAGWITAWMLVGGDLSPARSLLEHPREFLAAAFGVAFIILLVRGGRGRHRIFGLQWPDGHWWSLVTPAVLVGGVAGGAWLVWPLTMGGFPPGPKGPDAWLSLLGFPLLAELVFRGLAHGVMINNFSIQHSRGRWFLSTPVALSALLYAIWTLPFADLLLATRLWPLAAMISVPLGALVCGIGLGVARERSGSLVASLALHYLAVIAVLVAASLLR